MDVFNLTGHMDGPDIAHGRYSQIGAADVGKGATEVAENAECEEHEDAMDCDQRHWTHGTCVRGGHTFCFVTLKDPEFVQKCATGIDNGIGNYGSK